MSDNKEDYSLATTVNGQVKAALDEFADMVPDDDDNDDKEAVAADGTVIGTITIEPATKDDAAIAAALAQETVRVGGVTIPVNPNHVPTVKINNHEVQPIPDGFWASAYDAKAAAARKATFGPADPDADLARAIQASEKTAAAEAARPKAAAAKRSTGEQVLASMQRIEAQVRASRKETTDVLERIAAALELLADRPTVVTAHYTRKPK